MDARAKARRSLELERRQAINDGDLETCYQPVVNLKDGKVSCCEAPLRWRHPLRGMISPAEFIPVAEEAGPINQLGHWVLATGCDEAVSRKLSLVRVAVGVKSRITARVFEVAAAVREDAE